MKNKLGHLQVNIDPQNLIFYKELFSFLDWSVLYSDENTLGVGDKNGTSVWFTSPLKQAKNDYDGFGMNHLAIAVEQQAEVDQVVSYLKEKSVAALFETPRHRPEFCGDSKNTYYQVMFESPDKILFEVVYTGLKE
jgi:catechol 2,3-dioxygenase-like lactoylglutathione lyase family enzyme